MTEGVVTGHGPSSKVSTTSFSRRKSSCLKCSKPMPGPPEVSMATTRDTPSALGLAQAGFAGAGGGGVGVGAAAGAGAPLRGAGACAETAQIAMTDSVVATVTRQVLIRMTQLPTRQLSPRPPVRSLTGRPRGRQRYLKRGNPARARPPRHEEVG